MNFRNIARKLDPVVPARSLRDLYALHRWVGNAPPRFRQITNRHTHPRRYEVRLLVLNTWLMHVEALLELGLYEEAQKPAVSARAKELGPLIRDGFDVAVLEEVWEGGEQKKILEAWGRNQPHIAYGVQGAGDNPIWRVITAPFKGKRPKDVARQILGSGLMTISQRFPIMQVEQHTYQTEGRGFEKRAAKGVLLTRLRVLREQGSSNWFFNLFWRFGRSYALEIFSTHLSAGGDNADRRQGQIDELVDFYKKHHRPRNVALIVGDFNVNANREQYKDLENKMNSLGLTNLWKQDDKQGILYPGKRNYGRGYTAMKNVSRADDICPPALDNSGFCNDNIDHVKESQNDGFQRIDHIFVEEPRPSHGFDVDFTRPRRTRMKRSPKAESFEEAPFISDHLGLATTLLITPR